MTIWKYCSFVTSYLKANFLMIYQEFYCCYCFKKHSFQEPSLLQYHCKLMVTHSSPLAWKIPWSEEPGGLQSMGSLESDTTERLHIHFSLSCIGEGNGNPLQCSSWRIPGTGEPGGLRLWGHTESDMTEVT